MHKNGLSKKFWQPVFLFLSALLKNTLKLDKVSYRQNKRLMSHNAGEIFYDASNLSSSCVVIFSQ